MSGIDKKKRKEDRLSPQLSRRGFLSGSVALVGAGFGAGGKRVAAEQKAGRATGTAEVPPQTAVADITEQTLAEAEKLHGLDYAQKERAQLLRTIRSQIAAVKALRQIPRGLDLQPALIFDPRLPGVEYPAQKNKIVLAAGDPGPLPGKEIDIAFAPVTALARWIKTGELTSRRLTQIYLDRIERIAPKLFCFITVTRELALRQAEAMDEELAQGKHRGPLHGIPYGLKDVFDTAGIRTTWGSLIYQDRIPEKDAAVVVMLREAGAVLLGKLATGELANGTEWFGGNCRNPWNPEEPAGGSSTGAGSATAAGLCAFSIGTDSLGSILNPADRCGVVGLRATFGRVPVRGGMPLTPSLERIGPLCRAVEDAALVLAAINGFDPSSAASIDLGFEYDGGLDIRRLKVGYSPKWFEQVGFGPGASMPAGKAHLNALEVLKGLGVGLVEVELPPFPYGILLQNLYVESAAVFEELTLSGQDDRIKAQLDYSWPNHWREARLMSAVDYLQMERFRRRVMEAMDDLFNKVDALFLPTYGSFDLFLVTNFTGHPGLTLRAGLDQSPTRAISPVPIDLNGPKKTITQNVAFHGRLFEEGKILALGRALEAKLNVWHHRPPE